MHDFSIPIGPINPSIKEPVCVKLKLEGETVLEGNLDLGYAHKGIEHLLEGKKIEQALYIAQRICGICSFCHGNGFNRSIENILQFDPPQRVKYLRTLITELERIQSHTLWAGFMFHEFGLDTMMQYFLREREHILEIFERITGGRIHHDINKPKTVRYDIDDSDKSFILGKLKYLEEKYLKYLRMAEKDKIIKSRLEGVGFISTKVAKKFCLVGPNARASGINNDIRKIHPYDAFPNLDFEVVIDKKGDAESRLQLRLKEILESIKIIRQVLKDIPQEQIPKATPVFIQEGMGVSQVEAPRGENFYFTMIKENKIYRVKIRTPTFATISVLPELLRDVPVGDVPVILHSIDPCISCMERVIVIKDKKKEVLSGHEFLHKYCNHHH